MHLRDYYITRRLGIAFINAGWKLYRIDIGTAFLMISTSDHPEGLLSWSISRDKFQLFEC